MGKRVDVSSWVKELSQRLEVDRERMKEMGELEGMNRKQLYDKKAVMRKVEAGDRVAEAAGVDWQAGNSLVRAVCGGAGDRQY